MSVLKTEDAYMAGRLFGRKIDLAKSLLKFLLFVALFAAAVMLMATDLPVSAAGPEHTAYRTIGEVFYFTDTWDTDIVTTTNLAGVCEEWGQPWVGLHDIADDDVVTAKASVSGADVLAVTFQGARHGALLKATVYVPCLD